MKQYLLYGTVCTMERSPPKRWFVKIVLRFLRNADLCYSSSRGTWSYLRSLSRCHLSVSAPDLVRLLHIHRHPFIWRGSSRIINQSNSGNPGWRTTSDCFARIAEAKRAQKRKWWRQWRHRPVDAQFPVSTRRDTRQLPAIVAAYLWF